MSGDKGLEKRLREGFPFVFPTPNHESCVLLVGSPTAAALTEGRLRASAGISACMEFVDGGGEARVDVHIPLIESFFELRQFELARDFGQKLLAAVAQTDLSQTAYRGSIAQEDERVESMRASLFQTLGVKNRNVASASERRTYEEREKKQASEVQELFAQSRHEIEELKQIALEEDAAMLGASERPAPLRTKIQQLRVSMYIAHAAAHLVF